MLRASTSSNLLSHFRWAAVLAAALLIYSFPATAISETDRAAVEAVIKEYLLRNPEVLRDALVELEKRTAAAEEKRRAEALKTSRTMLVESPRGVVVGNPRGDVALVEFFDYNCGYCKRAMVDMLELIKNDPKLKVVLKEFPVLGPSSVEAARVAIAVRMQDPSKYLDFHRRLLSARGEVTLERALAAAKEAGLDAARIQKDMNSPEVGATLEESGELAEKLSISGTPSYVIGNEVVAGAVGFATLRGKIEETRKNCRGPAIC